jgi:hypothetical protein
MKLKGPNAYAREWIINGEHWQLKFANHIDKDTLGICDPSDKTITIKRGLDKVELLKTAIHEIIHSFELEYKFNLKHAHVYKLEDAIVDFVFNNFESLKRILTKT